MMARGKKKESALTPEEKLAQALVPDWEQPYKVPGNWKWIILGNLVEIRRGASPRPIKAYVTEDETGVNWIKIGDTDNGKYITHIAEKITSDGAEKSVFVEEGTLLLSNSMSFGRPYILKVNGCIHDGWLAITPSAAFNKEYLYYALLASEWYFEQVAVGTAVRNLNSERVAGTPIPCPPLTEQQRIVDRIEYLFAKLDEAKEKAQSVLDSFETRKAAILHKAFTGELTAKWRADYSLGMDSWKHAKFSDVLDVRDGTHDSPQYYDSGYPLVTSKNLKDGQITDKDIKYICQEDYDKINERSKVDVSDILFAMIGTIGNPVVVQVEPKFAIKNMALFKNIGKINPFFVKYYLESKNVMDKMQKEAKGSTQKFVALGYLRAFPINVPTEAEQTEIVRIFDCLFAKEQQAKEAAEAVLEKIDLLKKSILARAFRGELGTNDPTEESAVELLREILKGDI